MSSLINEVMKGDSIVVGTEGGMSLGRQRNPLQPSGLSLVACSQISGWILQLYMYRKYSHVLRVLKIAKVEQGQHNLFSYDYISHQHTKTISGNWTHLTDTDLSEGGGGRWGENTATVRTALKGQHNRTGLSHVQNCWTIKLHEGPLQVLQCTPLTIVRAVARLSEQPRQVTRAPKVRASRGLGAYSPRKC